MEIEREIKEGAIFKDFIRNKKISLHNPLTKATHIFSLADGSREIITESCSLMEPRDPTIDLQIIEFVFKKGSKIRSLIAYPEELCIIFNNKRKKRYVEYSNKIYESLCYFVEETCYFVEETC